VLALERQLRETLPILMTPLKDKIQTALDESRMLVLGAEILIGFEFAATFQEGFRGLSVRSQDLNGIALGLMLVTLVLLISPAAYHQIVEKDDDSDSLHRFATHVMEIALLPFAVALGANFYIPAEKINGARTGAIFGLAFTFLACIFWYAPSSCETRSTCETSSTIASSSTEKKPRDFVASPMFWWLVQ
jgi:Family of unknown function (DUF6328)